MPYLWLLFVIGSWALVVVVTLWNLSPNYYFIIIGAGLGLFFLKLYYYNGGLTPLNINYLTVAYYLVLFIYDLLIGSWVWDFIYWAFVTVDPDYFVRLFPAPAVFQLVARRSILLGALLCITTSIDCGSHRHTRALVFTNQVRIMEVFFIAMTLFLVAVGGWGFITIFLSCTSFFAMPDPVKLQVSRAAMFLFKKDVDLINVRVENNVDGEFMETRWIGHFLGLITLVVGGLIGGGLLHLQVAALILVVGIVTPPFL